MNTDTPQTDAEAQKPAFSPSEWIEFTKRQEREKRMLKFLLGQIISSLPARRDWLDPSIEELARVAVKYQPL